METTCYATDPLLEEAPEARPNLVGRVLVTTLYALTAIAAAVLVGAVFLHIAGPSLAVHTSPDFPVVLAAVAAFVTAVAIPLGLDGLINRPYRRADPLRHGPPRGLVATVWNTAVVLALVALCPEVTRAALDARGGWMVTHLGAPARDAVRETTRWVASRLPDHSPVQLTHASGESALDTTAGARLYR